MCSSAAISYPLQGFALARLPASEQPYYSNACSWFFTALLNNQFCFLYIDVTEVPILRHDRDPVWGLIHE